MQSHDFASTYVGTPYYMSPEICAAEKYTLHSDIWSLGCIMYELCTRKPPFDARTHFHLVQKIKEGRFDQPIPNIYSAELQNVIKSCLKTNPHQRPDTATLLQLPVVRLMRKEREVVEVGRLLQLKSDEADEKLKALDAQLATIDLERQKALAEIDSTVRREWEVKARLEIDRQIALETEKLRKEYESQVTTRVQEEVEKHLRSLAAAENTRLSSGRHTPSDIPQSSISTNEELEFPSQTDLTSLSFDSPIDLSQSTKNVPLKKSTRTPFARCRTTYDSPMDVHMASPSPLPVSNNVNSLALSPRRLAPLAPTNIFSTAAEQRGRWEPHFLSPTESADSEDEGNLDDADDQVPDLPSPTFVRKPLGQDPFKIPRPHLQRQATAPVARLQSQQAPLFAGKPAIGAVNLHTMFSKPKDGRPSTVMVPSQITVNAATNGAPRPNSPNRRISKVPMIIDAAGSPTRRPSVKKLKAANAGGEEMLKAVTSKNMFGAVAGTTTGTNANYMGNGNGGHGIGRTLVELSQEKAQEKVMVMQDGQQGEGAVKMAARVCQWDERDVPVWDPERDEMPSPFLARKGRAMA
jgi:serine/threonine protein kinase